MLSPFMYDDLEYSKMGGFIVREDTGKNDQSLRDLVFSLDMDMNAIKGNIDMIKDIEEELYYIREEMDRININLNAEVPDIMRMFLKFKELYRPIRILNESLYFTVQDMDQNFVQGRARVDQIFHKVIKRKKDIGDRE